MTADSGFPAEGGCDCRFLPSSKQPWVLLPAGVPAVPEYYDRRPYWPAASLERRTRLLAQG